MRCVGGGGKKVTVLTLRGVGGGGERTFLFILLLARGKARKREEQGMVRC